MTETHQFTLPDVGEGLTEAEIVKWHVAVGDTVEVNDTLVEVETAKSLVDLPSPYAGVIAKLHAVEGETVAVGSVIVSFTGAAAASDPAQRDAADSESEPAGEPHQAAAPQPTEQPADERQPVLVGYGPSRATVTRRPRKPGYRSPVHPVPVAGAPHRPYATPPVRLRARDLGVDLATVRPTGAWGQITRTDVDAAQTSAAADEAADPAETRIPVKGVRKATADAMVASAFTAPHVTEWVTVDVTDSLALLEQLRSDLAFAGVRPTPLVLIVRATLSALRAHPEINAKWDAEAGEIVHYRDVNLGIAAATPRGLLVPNIKAAQTLSTRELCDRLDELITTARDGKTQPAAMANGTFTITNIGVFGVDGGTPILNPGEAGILCVGQIARRPWEHQCEITLRSVCTLSLSFDHRLVDGQLGSQVLAHVARLLAQPSLALVH
ncbi:pyruvate/2-oxoglutarate dehydrogenase complex, dihydrolipoamide acyltransferase component [Mycobacterium sp. JS623]|uniref:dihydrolipoamide acetyltransferase family protein n=1 Tax=Mycobacterium sp. JS623 TaxID=212767 RepID=UPI0002A59DE8|nr:dihydrolipoamide acetyltransferase family protein [Mycobacterium sp. JS623]AGB22211.1 pyruvate/2-oxoglutarate dehydrogenase complex, dihydrolipoamide acyltransferase component [Mycobacterium sp. JS623]